MPQSLTRLYAHLIFSTKNREPFLDESIRSRVHGYLATTVRDLNSPWVVIGGVADHVHILFDMGKMVAPVKFVEQVKRESPKFIKTFGLQYSTRWCRDRGVAQAPTRLYAHFIVSTKNRRPITEVRFTSADKLREQQSVGASRRYDLPLWDISREAASSQVVQFSS